MHCNLLRNAWKKMGFPLTNFCSMAHFHYSPSFMIQRSQDFVEIYSKTVDYVHLRIGHSLLPRHPSELNLNSYPLCTRHHDETDRDFNHIIFNRRSFLSCRQLLFSFLFSSGYFPSESKFCLNH